MRHKKQKPQLAAVSLTISITPLNVNGLDNLIKRRRLSERLKNKSRADYVLSQRDTHFRLKDTNRAEEGMAKVEHVD